MKPKLSVVVEQTFANLDAGGQYHDLIDEFEVRALVDLSVTELETIDSPFLFFATVGKFIRKDTEGRKVYASQVDTADGSIWDSLSLRPDPAGIRRPLIVVYDEAHNLTDPQTERLLELSPSAFLLSTATARVPKAMQTEVVEFCPKAVTPYNLLWRARRVREPGRMAAARAELARLQQPREEPR